uniref:THAP domain-containing protein 1 n=1 Tax=Monopterus albus TaxID=43700 RepID=A0A3Q3IAN0_MONAL
MMSCACSLRETYQVSISFHHFPKDETLRKTWIRNVRRDNLVIKRTTTVCSRHFLSTDVIQGGRRRLKEGAVPVLFAWNDYSLSTSRPSVWERTQPPEEIEEEQMNFGFLLQCHDHARPEPSALDMAR